MCPTDTTALDDDDKLAVGARAIAAEGFDGQLNARHVYRLLETDPGWPAFKLAGKWTARPKAIRAEIRRREQRGFDNEPPKAA
jgi:hypothetical protein